MFFETTLTAHRIGASQEWWPNERLQDSLLRALERTPDKVAVTDVHGRLTYSQLAEQVDSCAAGLLGIGVRSGDVVTAQLPNWNEFVVLMLAVERIGAVLNPVAPIFRHRELRVMLGLAKPVVVVTAASFRGFSFVDMYQDLAPEFSFLKSIVIVGDEPGPGNRSWKDLLEAGRRSGIGSSVLDLFRPSPDAVAEIIFTSGTTGSPKGVMHTHNTLAVASLAMMNMQNADAGDVVHMASTFAHQTGYLYGARAFIQAGASAVFQDVWNPERFVELIESERITLSFGAAPFLSDLLRASNLDEHDISSFRAFGCFGAPIPQPLLEQARDRLPCRVMPGWGMTEVQLLTTTEPGDPEEKIVLTDGRPFAGNEVRVVDQNGYETSAGEEGDLQCRGSFEFVGYIQGRSFTESNYSGDGWFLTGDRARKDADGFIRITGRSKDIIIRGGENVPVKEVEDLLLRHPKVGSVVLVGVVDDRLGEVSCACVIPSDAGPPSLDDLKGFLKEAQVTQQFWPERIQVVSEFPMTPSGKVQKFKLRDQIQGATSEGSPVVNEPA